MANGKNQTQHLATDGQGNISQITGTTTAQNTTTGSSGVACATRLDPWGSPLSKTATGSSANTGANVGASPSPCPMTAGSTTGGTTSGANGTSTAASDAFYEGNRRDNATGDYQDGSRTYDPSKTAFISPDTYRTGNPDSNLALGTDPLTENRYNYVNGDPVNADDPDGHCQDPPDGDQGNCPDNPAVVAARIDATISSYSFELASRNLAFANDLSSDKAIQKGDEKELSRGYNYLVGLLHTSGISVARISSIKDLADASKASLQAEQRVSYGVLEGYDVSTGRNQDDPQAILEGEAYEALDDNAAFNPAPGGYTPFYRVEGAGNARVNLLPDGRVGIAGGSRPVFASFGNVQRAKDFLAKNVGQGHSNDEIKTLYLPNEVAKELYDSANTESLNKLFPDSPFFVYINKH